MRRPNRNIEIFSLSVLDLFAAAMGAFIIVALILFPYYNKDKDAKVALAAAKATTAQCLSENAQMASKQSTLESQAKTAQGQAAQGAEAVQKLQTCLAESASTFIVSVMRWPDEGYDIDLHVVDSNGRIYYFNDPKFGDAELSYDNKQGPGIEIWQNPKATAGSYCLAFHLYNYSATLHPEPAAKVDGRVFFRNGASDIPAMVLSKANPYVKAGTIELSAAGKFSFHAGRWSCAEEPEKLRAPPSGSLGAAGAKRLLR